MPQHDFYTPPYVVSHNGYYWIVKDAKGFVRAQGSKELCERVFKRLNGGK